MNKAKLFSILLFVLSFFILFCSKDENKEAEEYRVKKMIWEDSQSEFFYNKEKLISVNDYKTDCDLLAIDGKDSIQYIDNNVIMTTCYLNEENEYKETIKMVYTVNGNQVTAFSLYLMFDQSWKEVGQYEYEYQNGKLIGYGGFIEDSESRYETKTELIYEDKLLMQSVSIDIREGSVDSTSKKIYEYKNGNLTAIIEYVYSNGSWIENLKKEYEWNNGKITSIIEYDYYDNEWELDFKDEYKYNSKGYLSSINGEIFYEYEKGKGNIEFFSPPEFAVNQTPGLSKITDRGNIYERLLEKIRNLPHNHLSIN